MVLRDYAGRECLMTCENWSQACNVAEKELEETKKSKLDTRTVKSQKRDSRGEGDGVGPTPAHRAHLEAMGYSLGCPPHCAGLHHSP